MKWDKTVRHQISQAKYNKISPKNLLGSFSASRPSSGKRCVEECPFHPRHKWPWSKSAFRTWWDLVDYCLAVIVLEHWHHQHWCWLHFGYQHRMRSVFFAVVPWRDTRRRWCSRPPPVEADKEERIKEKCVSNISVLIKCVQNSILWICIV